MKATKKILAVLLVVMMIASLSATAFAAPATNGEITIQGAKSGKIFDLYRVFDASVSNGSAGYTMTSKWEPFFIGTGAPGAAYISATAIANAPQVDVNGTTYWLNITDGATGNVAAFAYAAQTWALANTTPDQSATATADGDFKIENLPVGYYLIYPRGAVNPNSNSAGLSIAALTTTMPTATVAIKGDYPETPFTKQATDPNTQAVILSADIGKVLPYTITGKVPDTTGYSKYEWKVTDTMGTGLTFNASSPSDITLKINNTAVAIPASGTIADGNSNGLAKLSCTVNATGFVLSIDMTEYQTEKNSPVEISYSATINANAIVETGTNTATLSTPTTPGQEDILEPIPNPPAPVVTTNSIVVKKVISGGTTPLAGATFALQNSNGQYYKRTGDVVTWVDNLTDATTYTTAVNTTTNEAAVTFAGIADGTYSIVETEAPSGYNKLNTPRSATVSQQTDPVTQAKSGQTHTETIENSTGAVLPGTGGIGTTIFYVLGSCLLIGAAVLLITRKRMGNEG